MRQSVFLATVFALALTGSAHAAPAAAPAGSGPSAGTQPAAQPAKPRYTTTDTEIGILLDDPAAKAILEKVIPGMTTNDQIDMARSMTLKSIQTYAPDQITDERLAQLDEQFAKLAK